MYDNSEELQMVIQGRLNRKHLLDIGQEAQWLCVGLFTPKRFTLTRLIHFLSEGSTPRLENVISFLQTEDHPPLLYQLSDWKSMEIAHLIQALAGHLKTHDHMVGHESQSVTKSRR